MKFGPATNKGLFGERTRLARGGGRLVRRDSGFTLAEVLAALLFMAIVIPVAVEGLRIASRAGEVAVRKGEAARVAERVLNESIVSSNLNQSVQTGTFAEGGRQFRWTLRNELWAQNTTNRLSIGQSYISQVPMNLLSVEVKFAVQDRDYSVRLSTLANTTQ